MNNIDGAFLRALQEHKQGDVLTELSVRMREAVAAARRIGKPAALSLEVKFTPNGNAIAFSAEVKAKLPREADYAGIFFPDEVGNLFRNDPLQQTMELKTVEVPAQTQELRKAVAS